MASAPRRFYFHLRALMLKVGFEISRFDECVFLWRVNGKLRGVAGYHVDDGLLSGDESFWQAMGKVATLLKFGTRKKKDFKFCGVRIRQYADFSVELDQEDALNLIEPIPIKKGRPDSDPLTEAEVTQLRGRLGSLLYLTGNTRPFEAYAVSHIAGFVTEATVRELKLINAVIKHAKATKHLHIHYKYRGGARPLLYTFCDSNFKRERDGGSQMGLLSVIGPPLDSKGSAPVEFLRYNSKRAKRVAHATLTAETLAATQALDQNTGTRLRLSEFELDIEGVILTDCRSLFDGLYSMTGKTAEMLVPDFYELREAAMPWRFAHSDDYDGLPVELWWVPTELQLADNLTKLVTPSTKEFLRVLETGVMHLPRYERPRVAQRALQSF